MPSTQVAVLRRIGDVEKTRDLLKSDGFVASSTQVAGEGGKKRGIRVDMRNRLDPPVLIGGHLSVTDERTLILSWTVNSSAANRTLS